MFQYDGWCRLCDHATTQSGSLTILDQLDAAVLFFEWHDPGAPPCLEVLDGTVFAYTRHLRWLFYSEAGERSKFISRRKSQSNGARLRIEFDLLECSRIKRNPESERSKIETLSR